MPGHIIAVLTGVPRDDTFLDDFAAAAIDVEAREPETLDWRLFQQADGTLRFLDIYASSEAFLGHFGRAQESGLLETFLDKVELKEVLLLGDPSAEARAAVAEFGAAIASPAAGFSRLGLPAV